MGSMGILDTPNDLLHSQLDDNLDTSPFIALYTVLSATEPKHRVKITCHSLRDSRSDTDRIVFEKLEKSDFVVTM